MKPDEQIDEEGFAPPPEDRGRSFKELLGALVLLAVSLGFLIASLRIPFHTSNWVWYTSPGIFALSMALCLGACSLFVARREYLRWREVRNTGESVDWAGRLRSWGIKRLLAASFIILAYIFLLGKLPFLIVSIALILILGTIFREGRFVDALRPSVIASVVIAGIAVAISKIFGITFP